MAAGDRARELLLLRREHKRLRQLLTDVGAAVTEAAALCVSVRRRLGRLAAGPGCGSRSASTGAGDVGRAAADESSDGGSGSDCGRSDCGGSDCGGGSDGSSDPPELRLMRSLAAPKVHLHLLIRGRRVSVDLPCEATVDDLQSAVHSAGGPVPARQQLAVGMVVLRVRGSTPLSETRLVRDGVAVDVRYVQNDRSLSAGGTHALALLDDGAVVGWGGPPVPELRGVVTSVHASESLSCAIVDGRVEMWGAGGVNAFQRDLEQLSGLEVLCCAASASMNCVAAVADGRLFLFGPNQDSFPMPPAQLQGRLAAVSLGFGLIAGLTADGTVVAAGTDSPDEWWTPSLFGAVAVSAGNAHYAALLGNGTVRCFGRNGSGQCDVPPGLKDVVQVECGTLFTVALRRDGALVWWGNVPQTSSLAAAGRCVALSAGHRFAVAVTVDGRLVADGDGRRSKLSPPDLAGRRVL